MKFRAKRKYGNEVITGYYNAIDGVHHYILKDDNLNGPDWFEIDPTTLAMSTGQTDKNGTMIYGSVPVEGVMSKGSDIVHSSSNVPDDFGGFIVVFEDGAFYIQHVESNSIHCYLNETEIEALNLTITGKQYKHGSKS